jgi:hypothetical protein
MGCGERATEVHHGAYDKQTMLGATLKHLYSLCRACHQSISLTAYGQPRAPQEVQEMTLALVGQKSPKPKKPKHKKFNRKLRGFSKDSKVRLGQVRAASLEYALGLRK